MRYSRGNRGGKSRQWGLRQYDEAKVQRQRLPLDAEVTFDIDVYFIDTDEGERMRFDAICSGCNARYFATHLEDLKVCLCCNRPVKQRPAEH